MWYGADQFVVLKINSKLLLNRSQGRAIWGKCAHIIIELTYNMHLFHIRFLREDRRISGHFTMIRTGCVEVNIFQLKLLFVGVFPLCVCAHKRRWKREREGIILSCDNSHALASHRKIVYILSISGKYDYVNERLSFSDRQKNWISRENSKWCRTCNSSSTNPK